jgi:hypothetical protein
MEIVQNSGILVEAGPSKAYEFRHNALREYLAARRLLTLEDPTERAALNAHLTDRRWVGVWRLAAAMSADCTELLDAIGKAGHNDDLVARCLGDAQRVQPRWISTRLDEQGASRAFGNLMLRLREQLTASERLELFGEILWRDTELFARESRRTDTRALYVALSGILGMVATEGPMAHRAAEQLAGWRSELRLDVESSPYALVPVAAGLVLLGDDGSPHQRFRQVEGFSIGQTPVTFDLYQRFDPSHALAGAAHAEEFVQPSLPVVGVSWYDAWVCACWFSCRLPTTAEWEKAAGWDAGRSHRQAFPWGDEWEAGRCNALVSTTQPGSTSPVDRFATRGQSPYGCYDMAGNVLEWTADRARGSVERRILKGGSWRGDAVMQRVSAEVWLRPGYHGLETGFRLCRSLTPAR